MKKIIATFLILFTGFFSENLFAADDCDKSSTPEVKPTCTVIESGPSEKISKYVSDLTIVFSEIKNNIKPNCGGGKNGENNASATLKQGTSQILGDVNKNLDFSSFLSSWEFYLKPIFTGEVVDPLFRDHDLIRRQQDKINNITSQAGSNCALSLEIKGTKIADTIGKYGVNKAKLATIEGTLSELRILNNKVTNFYRCVVTDIMVCDLKPENGSTEKTDLDDLVLDIQGDAKNKGNYKGCKATKMNWDKFACKLKKVWDSGLGYEKGIEEWKKALTLLSAVGKSKSDEEYKKLEKELLAKELGKQGLNTQASAVILKNLDNFNACSDDGIKCFVKNISNSVVTVINQFEEIWVKDFKNEIFSKGSTNKFIQKVEKLGETKGINEEITENYNRIKSQLTLDDTNLDKNIGNLLQVHQILIDLNQKLEKDGTKTSKKVCDSQAKGIGNCEF
ncbi:hypothetical protein KAZ01_00720 [Candidatus Gracilibacteria bacterium]|nr:hypothetical protein [Candidatus Gracilibacteria bacterium]